MDKRERKHLCYEGLIEIVRKSFARQEGKLPDRGDSAQSTVK